MEKEKIFLKCERHISLEEGKVDAMLAALVGVLRATRDNREVSENIVRALTDAYPREGPRSQDRSFVDGFGKAVDQLLGALQQD